MGDLPHRVPNDPRYFTADVHITPDGKARIGGHEYTPAEYADMLRRAGYDGSRPVRLIGCDAGSNDFAQQLSRHLDAPVLAPTKPAWTDTNGRVFTSDAEILPDGTRQPKIPPNGEWETHYPDGSTSKAGDDGFAPGTHDKDKDLDPSDARERGNDYRHIPREPVEIETRTPKASMEEKINDPKYREKYYLEPDSEGRVQRKQQHYTDANGDPVPAVRQQGDRYVLADEQTPLPPNFHTDRVNSSRGEDVSPELKRENQDLVDERRAENRNQKDADTGSPEEKAAQARLTKLGEELGDRAGMHSTPEIYPGPPPPTRLDPGLPGSGRFDQVWETSDGRLVVVEAKGPSAGLGNALNGDNVLVKQGHDTYFEKIAEEMRDRELSPKAERKMRAELEAQNMSKADIDKAVDDLKAAYKRENELGERLLAASNNPNHPGVEYVMTQAKVKEMDLDNYLQTHHADDVKGMTPDELDAYKREHGFNDKYPDGRVDVYDGYETKHFKMKWQTKPEE
jgi:hypothetical protein